MSNSKNLRATTTSRLCTSTAIVALAALYPITASAQTGSPADSETVTVTGTIIKGTGPTGSNVITVDRNAIEAIGATTVGQVLADIPGLNNFGSAGQGAQNSADPGGASSPTIHSLGSSASNGTLILVDSHRLPYTGIQHNTIDPSAIPVIALQRVEVLPDGASSTYGSDAVAGVLNFITRKNFTGIEFEAQYGMADHYESFSAGGLFGHDWQGGSAMVAYEYVSKSQFSNGHRSFQTARQDQRLGLLSAADTAAEFPNLPAGTTQVSEGSNFQNFNCPTATIRSSGTIPAGAPAASLSFAYPYAAGTGISNTATTPGLGICDEAQYGTWLPSETRNTVFMSFKQQIGDNIALTADFDYSTRFEGQINAKGTLNSIVTVFGPTSGRGSPAPGTAFSPTTGAPLTTLTSGGQINPFYTVGSTGISTAQQQISYDFTPLLLGAGLPPTREKTGDTVAFADLGMSWDMGNDWELDVGGSFGIDYDFDRTTNALCQACAYLALNGTTNFQGNPNTSIGTSAIADPQGLGTILGESRSLTTLNALDVWNPPGATNRTSTTVLQQLNGGFSNTTATQGLQDVNAILHGQPFSMPAGPVKFALGAEYMHTTDQQLQNTLSSAEGPTSVASQTVNLFYGRTVWSAFAEVLVPLVSPEMNVPLVQKLDVDFSGRVDQYTTYGFTKNPKIGFTWDMFDGFRSRGSFGTSFTVPAFASGGQNQTGITSQSGVNSGGVTNNLLVPFNDTTFNNSAGVAGTWLATPAGCAAGGSSPANAAGVTVAATDPTAVACKINTTNTQGIQYAAGGKPGLKPEVGMTYSAGIDFDLGKFADALDGLTGEVTFYQAKYAGLVTSIGLATAQPGLTTFAPPGGWSPTDPFITSRLAGYPLNVTLPSQIYYFFDGRQTNAYTLWQNGLDYSLRYVIDTDLGTFNAGISGNEILRFTQRNIGPNNPLIDIKNGKAGSSGRFAGQEMTWRTSLGWSQGPYRLQMAYNFQSPYFASVTTYPYTTLIAGAPGARPGVTAGNVQKIAPLQTIDLTAGYVLPDTWYSGLSGTVLTLSVTNLLDTDPPFQDNANGFGPGSQLGRLVTLSLKKTF